MIPLAALAIVAACVPIDAPADRITAADLARVLSEWSQVDPVTAVALAPAPGVIRILRATELQRLASRFGVAVAVTNDICFQRPVAAVEPERMLAVMRARLPGAQIEVLETSRVPAPAGQLDFPLTGLRPGYWSGYVSYGAGHKFVVWARVHVRHAVKRIVASADLVSGQPIETGQLSIEMREELPVPGRADDANVESVEDLAGLVPRRSIRAGTVVQKEWLDAPKLIQRGETVKVEIEIGSARLETEGIAESSGALGEIILVRNSDSKRRVRARVESRGLVSVKAVL